MIKLPKQKESVIQLQILKYLRVLGAYAGKTRTMGVRHGKTFYLDQYIFLGFPDLTFFYKQKLYFCECKSRDGKQSEAQKKFEIYCEWSGIRYILARSVEDVQDALRKDGHNV